MIEFSSGKVTGSSWDAYGLAFLLLIFALLSSGYVLRHGIAQKGNITFELLLRCVLIITSVIPAEFPMQAAMAVNSALLNLVKLSIFVRNLSESRLLARWTFVFLIKRAHLLRIS
ncbi:hypothetical protein PsorP6_016844 [Peronosclerospora sorghi]|nr:hypothetical protein PsorP6_016844 [Peronosclerospora sorghi]